MKSSVEIEITGPVAVVSLNRPDKLNAMDMSVFEGLINAGDELAQKREVRAIVLRGQGSDFCSGLDISAMGGSAAFMGRAFEVGERSPANFAQRAAVVWQEVPQPVIAAIHGKCFGGGLQLAMGADIRFGAQDIDMRVLEIKWGIIPDMGITQTFLNVVSLDTVKELMWTGRPVGAQEALRLGLLTHVSEQPLEDAMKMAAKIATRSPDAVQKGKTLFNTAWRSGLAEGYELEARLQKQVLGTPNQLEAVMSNFEKRKANFK